MIRVFVCRYHRTPIPTYLARLCGFAIEYVIGVSRIWNGYNMGEVIQLPKRDEDGKRLPDNPRLFIDAPCYIPKAKFYTDESGQVVPFIVLQDQRATETVSVRNLRYRAAGMIPPSEVDVITLPAGYEWCNDCMEFKPKTEFSPDRRNKFRGVQSYCKPCQRMRVKMSELRYRDRQRKVA